MNVASSTQLDKLLRDIALRKLQLRRLACVLLVDVEFLYFCDACDEVERALLHASDEELDRLPLNSGAKGVVSLLELKVHSLQRAKIRCLQRIASFNDARKVLTADELRKDVVRRLENALKQLQQSHKLFRNDTLAAISSLGDIHRIAELESVIAHTDHLAGVVRKNHINFLSLLQPANLEYTVSVSCARLRFVVNSLVIIILVQFCELLGTMDGEEGIHGLHAQLQADIRLSLNEMQVNEEELASLREKLFPSAVSLPTQRTVAIEQHELREFDLQEKLRMIDALEDDRQEVEGRVAQLIEKREAIQRQLDESKTLLQDGVREIFRLERLIEVIEREISDATVQFQEETKNAEQRRREVLESPNLSFEQRQTLLEEHDSECMERRTSHASKLDLLEARRSEYKQRSASLAQDLETFRDEIGEKQQDTRAELEKRILTADPSQLELIETNKRQLRAEHDDNLAMLNRARARSEHLAIDHGSYSVVENGGGVYRQSSAAAEQRPDMDGQLVNDSIVVNEFEDENGLYFLDKFGKRIYRKQYFTDPQGRYYIDDTGTRVYVAPALELQEFSSKSDFKYTFRSIEAEHPPAEDSLSDSASVQERRERIAADVAYVQETLGKSLIKGLALVAREKPLDPVGYLADYLALCSKNAIETEKRQQLLKRAQAGDTSDCTEV